MQHYIKGRLLFTLSSGGESDDLLGGGGGL